MRHVRRTFLVYLESGTNLTKPVLMSTLRYLQLSNSVDAEHANINICYMSELMNKIMNG